MVAIFCYLFPKMWLFLILWWWREKWLFLIILWLKSMKMFWQPWLSERKKEQRQIINSNSLDDFEYFADFLEELKGLKYY